MHNGGYDGDDNQEHRNQELEPVFIGVQKDSTHARKKPRHRFLKIIAGIILVLALVVASSIFYGTHDIYYSNGEGGLRFSITPRDPNGVPPQLIQPTPQPVPDAGQEQPEGTDGYLQNNPTDDGTTLVINGGSGSASAVSDQALTIKQIAKRVKPSVVGIVSEVRASSAFGGSQAGSSSGTGIIMDAAGYIITNCHVIDDAINIKVILDNNNEYEAILIGKDQISDLAVIKIEPKETLTTAEFGNSDALEVGDTAVAIGNPLGIELRGTVTDGIISAINRDIKVEGRNMTLLQTNAALNAGNSGGPLINEYGQVVGINTVKIMTSYYDTVEGLGFAIPINTAAPIVNSLIRDGYVKGRPAIGITGEDIPEAAANYYKMPQGVYVRSVNQDADAYRQGVLEGDIIIGINGQTTENMVSLNKIKDTYSSGDRVTLNIYRKGSYIDIEITLADAAELN